MYFSQSVDVILTSKTICSPYQASYAPSANPIQNEITVQWPHSECYLMLLAAQKKTPLALVLCFDLFEFLQGFEYLLKSSLQLWIHQKRKVKQMQGGEGVGGECEKWGLVDEKMSSCLQWRQEGVEGNKAN